MSWTRRGHRVKEKTIDPTHPPARRTIRGSLLTLSPDGPWFYAVLILLQVGAVGVLTRLIALPFGLTLATLFATEGIVSFAVAWFLSGREGDIGFAALSQTRRAQIAGAPDLATSLPEHQADFELAARNAPVILILVLYGAVLLVLAFVAAV